MKLFSKNNKNEVIVDELANEIRLIVEKLSTLSDKCESLSEWYNLTDKYRNKVNEAVAHSFHAHSEGYKYILIFVDGVSEISERVRNRERPTLFRNGVKELREINNELEAQIN